MYGSELKLSREPIEGLSLVVRPQGEAFLKLRTDDKVLPSI